LGILHRDPEEKSRNCWTVPDSKIFKVRSKNFPQDKSKVKIFQLCALLLGSTFFLRKKGLHEEL